MIKKILLIILMLFSSIIERNYSNSKLKIEDFKYEDIEILDYNSHPSIKGRISV